MCICYADNFIFSAPDESDIDKQANQLISDGVLLEQKSDMARFLEVYMETDLTIGLM